MIRKELSSEAKEIRRVIKKTIEVLKVSLQDISNGTHCARSSIRKFLDNKYCMFDNLMAIIDFLYLELHFVREDGTECFNIEAECLSHHLTQKEIAKNAGVSYESVHKFFKGNYNIREQTVEEVLGALKMHIEIRPKKVIINYTSKEEFLNNVSNQDIYRQFAREGYDESQRQLKRRIKSWLDKELNGYNLSCKDYKALMVSFDSLF